MSDNSPTSETALDERSLYLRSLAVDALAGGSRGHIGSTMSLIEIFRVLYDDIAVFKPDDPRLPSRDRIILSKGHGCIAQYALLADKGFFAREELASFCSFSSILGGHPELGHVPGVEASTGSLGHGLSLGVGMAQAARIRGESHRVFVVLGDGELNEGSVWEAAMSAGHRRLSNLMVIVDYNKMQSFGPTSNVWELEPLASKWAAFGFEVREADGHDVSLLKQALQHSTSVDRPRVLIAHTVKGKGIGFAEGKADWHHKSNLDAEAISSLREEVGYA